MKFGDAAARVVTSASARSDKRNQNDHRRGPEGASGDQDQVEDTEPIIGSVWQAKPSRLADKLTVY